MSTYVSGNVGAGNTVLGIKMARQGPQFHESDILIWDMPNDKIFVR